MVTIRRSFMPVLYLAASAAWSPPADGQDGSREVPTRDQIAEKYKWNLQSMYADLPAWEADFARCETSIAKLEKRQGTLGKSAQDLYDTLEENYETYYTVDKLYVYAHQRSDENTGDSAALGPKNRAITLMVSYDQASSWIEPELLTLPEETLRSWCKEHRRLSVYQHYLDDVIRKKAHTLSMREEELLAMAGNLAAAPGSTFTVLSNAELIWPTIKDEQGQEVQLSSARYSKYKRSPNRRVRRDAFMGCMKAYQGFENTIAATLNGAVQRDLYFARARRFDSCLEASLFPDNLPLSVYTNLVETINKNLSVQHRWAALRKKVLEVDELHVYDLYQPLVTAVDKEIEYDDGVDMIVEALAPLGREYCDAMRRGFASRWIDVYETKGKRSGAYSWGSYDTQPYILLNYTKTLNDVSTIAHEMGHSMHSYFTTKTQPKVYGAYSPFVAEVASTFNEILLEDHLLKNAADPKERLYLLNHAVDGLRQTVVRQVMFSEFEHGNAAARAGHAPHFAQSLCAVCAVANSEGNGHRIEDPTLKG